MRRIWAGVAVAAAFGAAPVGPGLAEWKRLDGTWRVVSYEKDGAEQPTDQMRDRLLLTFETGNFSRGEGMRGQVARIDPAATPKEIDYKYGGSDRVELAIYALEGDVLVHCTAPAGRPRPKGFTSEKGSGHTLVVYKRVKKRVD